MVQRAKRAKKMRSRSKQSKKRSSKGTKRTSKSKASVAKKKKGTGKSTKSLKGLAQKSVEKEGKLIGTISHYFPKVKAGVLTIQGVPLNLGDRILIKGHTTRLKQTVSSMQIDRAPISIGSKGDEIGLQVKQRVRVGDKVFLLR